MTATMFVGGSIWTGRGETDALLIDDGVVVAVGDEARRHGARAARVLHG